MAQGEVVDVAIVGFGPSGVVAAALLGQAGLRVHVCDRMATVHEIPRAIALDHEIMRVFQQIGVVDAVMPHCEPFTPSEFFGVDGQLIRRMTMVAPPYPQGWTPSMVFTQPPVEQALRDRVAQLPNVTVALSTETTGLVQDADGVTLTQRDAAGEHMVRARWAIACDGGGSSVRGWLGLQLEDLDFDEPWLVVDVRVNARGLAKLPRTSVQYCEPERPCTLVIGPGNHRRWEISLKPGEDPKQAATPEATWALLSRWLTPEDGTLWRQSSYRFHALVAEHWRAGRVFLAGDAAHMQPPFLGQGMCQGVRDVANLALEARGRRPGPGAGRRGRAPARQLWRRAQGPCARADHPHQGVGSVICERDLAKARARDARLLADCGYVVKDTPRQDILPRLETGLLAVEATSGRGRLFPQPRLATGELMDQRYGSGWRLVVDEDLADVAGAPGLEPLVVTRGEAREAEGVVAAWMEAHDCHAALVRPDHYVYGTADTAAALDALLAQWHQALH